MRFLLPVFILGLQLSGVVAAPATLEASGGMQRAADPMDRPKLPLPPRELLDYSNKGIPDDKWEAVLECLGIDETRAAARDAILRIEPFPAERLVSFLSSQKLPVRLGALELLEERAGESFGFDPWKEQPETNAEALGRWREWLNTGAQPASSGPPTLNEASFKVLAVDIMGADRDRSERAMERLAKFGTPAIAAIDRFTANHPDLTPAANSVLVCAKYRALLTSLDPKKAPGLARDLAYGNPETQTTALDSVAALGAGTLPILADFLNAPDPLVREAAVDAAFQAGKKDALPLILPRAKSEKTESVLHAMLRGIGKNFREDALPAVTARLHHESENVVVSALEALAGSEGLASKAKDSLKPMFDDPRWRVRAAALGVVEKGKLKEFKDRAVQMLDDPDSFVRTSAVAALSVLDDLPENLLEKFAAKDDLKPSLLPLLIEGRKLPLQPKKVIEPLSKAPPETILQCLDVIGGHGRGESGSPALAVSFIGHDNPDVSAAALRICAENGLALDQLLAALRSKDDKKVDAVLDVLALPPRFLAQPVRTGTTSKTKNSALDRLYAAFSSMGSSSGGSAPNSAAWREALDGFFKDGSPRQRFHAAVALLNQNDQEAAAYLLKNYETFSSLDRRVIGARMVSMASFPSGPAEDLARTLLRDESEDVREMAIEAWKKPKSVERMLGLLQELTRPNAQLNPADVYDYNFNQVIDQNRAKFVDWATLALASGSTSDPVKVFACVILGNASDAKTRDLLSPLTRSENQWVRRAAYHTLGKTYVAEHLEEILKDPAGPVRETIPAAAAPDNDGWRHWFDDTHEASTYSYDRRPVRLLGSTPSGDSASKPNPFIPVLWKLADDPSANVRFEAQFALLKAGELVDAAAFAQSIQQLPKESRPDSRIARFLENSYRSLPKDFAVLMPYIESSYDQARRQAVRAYFESSKGGMPLTWTQLSGTAPVVAAAEPAATPTPLPAATPAGTPPQEFRVLFFSKAGCRECNAVRSMLADLARKIPAARVEELKIENHRNAEINETLSQRFGVPSDRHQVTPAVFVQAGALIRKDITPVRLQDLLEDASGIIPDPGWAEVPVDATVQAQEQIETRYHTFSFWVVALAGLLDGINPCAFATIIFLLSYLQVTRRSPREVLAVGSAFVCAVFLAYFAVGAGLSEILARATVLRFFGAILNYTLAGFTLVVAMFSFRDARLAAAGKAREMTLQLPERLKERIRATVRTGSRARNFVIAAFVAGIVVSLLELACTGQVYLPTIMYMVQNGETGAYGHLLFYNLAFVTPLICVFALTWFGLRSDALLRWQTRHTATVKWLTGLLFLFLAAFLLFGSTLFGSR